MTSNNILILIAAYNRNNMPFTTRAQLAEKNVVVKVGLILDTKSAKFNSKNKTIFDDIVILGCLSSSGVWHMISILRSEENPFLLLFSRYLLTYCSFLGAKLCARALVQLQKLSSNSHDCNGFTWPSSLENICEM